MRLEAIGDDMTGSLLHAVLALWNNNMPDRILKLHAKILPSLLRTFHGCLVAFLITTIIPSFG